LALCETFQKGGTQPALANFRAPARKVFDEIKNEHIWFGIEQEYVIFARTRGSNIIWPFGWPQGGYPAPQGQYYCSVGPGNAFGRALAEAHMRCCLYAGLKISGINAEVLPSQWEFQIGPCEGISLGDELWIARYIMNRLCEEFNLDVSFEPKPFRTGDWNGSGAHINISTEKSRAPGGMKAIEEYMKLFAMKHKEHLSLYGENNQYRLTGRHETASMNQFKYGVADRGASVRIPRTTALEDRGYFEDRRPASNVDPYLATAAIGDTMCAQGKYIQELLTFYSEFKRIAKPEERYL
jgi:glutamine synthetase